MTPEHMHRIAAQLSAVERTLLQGLPATDRGHLPDAQWWGYCALLDEGLAQSDGQFGLSATALGQAVLRRLAVAG